jgi:MYXO-CTERM domain-containing protein
VILSAFNAVGSVPVLVDVPMGEACTISGECTSGLCAVVDSDAGRVCTQSCATASCPDGFRCDTAGGQSLCAPSPSSGCAVSPRDGPWSSLFAAGLVIGLGVAARRRRPSP